MKPLAKFAVTNNGIQFKITSLSKTRTRRVTYEEAYRMQVSVNFLSWNVNDIIDMSESKHYIQSVVYRFITALHILGAEKQFNDKLKIAALSTL